MNPNSQNQQWSEWAFVVKPGFTRRLRPFEEVKSNVARFLRKLFGSSARMRILHKQEVRDGLYKDRWDTWEFFVQVENANANDPDKRVFVENVVRHFMRVGFGDGTTTTLEVRLLAGRPEDGRPADQWLILPPALRFPNVVGGELSV